MNFSKTWFCVSVCLILSGGVMAAHSAKEGKMTLTVTSEAFSDGEPIPKKFTGEGANHSPPLAWTAVPQNAKELAVICDDPDAPRPEPWDHWVLYKIPVSTTQLREAIPPDAKLSDPAGAVQGKNSWEKIGYGGPLPPQGHGWHRYFFRVYALDAPLALAAGASKAELLRAMKGHILAEGELVGKYRRE